MYKDNLWDNLNADYGVLILERGGGLEDGGVRDIILKYPQVKQIQRIRE